MKKEAIRLHVEEKLTYRRIMEHLEIQDADRVKKWMRKYREQGDEKFTNHFKFVDCHYYGAGYVNC
ncbi:transposase [Paenibacillus lautus]|uniref:helix-turn-helix domain-containing protein n=1 Tax=Paenibacillus lautus TaxID=1401 RepID=UPI003D2A976C